MSCPFIDARDAFRAGRRAAESAFRFVEHELAAGRVPSRVVFEVPCPSREAAVLVEAAYASFRPPPSGATLRISRQGSRTDVGGWRVVVEVIYPEVAP